MLHIFWLSCIYCIDKLVTCESTLEMILFKNVTTWGQMLSVFSLIFKHFNISSNPFLVANSNQNEKKNALPSLLCHGLQENAFQVNQLYNVTWSNKHDITFLKVAHNRTSLFFSTANCPKTSPNQIFFSIKCIPAQLLFNDWVSSIAASKYKQHIFQHPPNYTNRLLHIWPPRLRSSSNRSWNRVPVRSRSRALPQRRMERCLTGALW